VILGRPLAGRAYAELQPPHEDTMTTIDTTVSVGATAAGANVETAGIGNRAPTLPQKIISSSSAAVSYFGVRWDGDKVRGIRVDFTDGTSQKAGGFDDGGYTLTEYRFRPGEVLSRAVLRDSGYGYGSVRQIRFTTSSGGNFECGANGYDSEATLDVEGSLFVGIHAWVNPDNFINGLTFYVRRDAKPAVTRAWFETKSVGNRAAAYAPKEVNVQAANSTALSLSVRWDGDKVRGMRMVLRNGTTIEAGGINDVNYALDSYTFGESETLTSLSMSSSGYGYGSLRRLEFTTSTGGHFKAGPDGIDDLVTPPVTGACFVGFHAWVNVDNFVNALAFCVTNDAPMVTRVQNSSPWECIYDRGAVIVNGTSRIQVADLNAAVGTGAAFNRAISVTSGGVGGQCNFNGAAVLTISVFGDATFEAKFSVDEGSGVASAPIAGLAPSASKPTLIEALVRKHAPIYMLNVDEVYWQSNVDAFLPHMIMQTVTSEMMGNPPARVYYQHDFYTGPLNRNVLAQQAVALGSNNTGDTACLRTAADLNSPSDTQDWFNSTRPTQASQLATYAVVIEGSNGKLDIVYWWFFNYNQGKTVAGTSWGNHVSDWEHVKVQLGNVDFAHPQNERVLAVVYDHHGDKETHAPTDGVAEFSGRQVLVHLANGDHEAYPRVGVYDRPMGTHDYCKDNAYRFDTRGGQVEIYAWNGSDFNAPPAGASANFKDPAWIRYHGRWGNWQRGDLMGFIARLESGPEGIFRPGEYAIPS
jgi:hypothetical protein